MAANPNQAIVDELREIGNQYRFEGDSTRARAYFNASNAILGYNKKIVSGQQAFQEIRGVGRSIRDDIDALLYNNENLSESDEDVEYFETMKYLESFHGIGPVKANEFYQAGYRTAEDLLKHANLTHAQRVGIKWHDDIENKIPRSEMDELVEAIDNKLAPYNIEWSPLGSYRRGKPISGDIDVLVIQNPDQEITTPGDVVKILGSLIVDSLTSHGKTKYMGIIRLPGKDRIGRRIDIKITTPEEYPYALFYFTGSKQFNTLIRDRAIREFGLHLSEHGFEDKKGNRLLYDVSSENDIFDILRTPYIAPSDRVDDMVELSPILT